MATQKKTADVDYSMQEKIIALYELQKIDSKIDEMRSEDDSGIKRERTVCKDYSSFLKRESSS